MENDIELIKKRIKNKRNNINSNMNIDNIKTNYLKNLLSRFLITIILVLLSVIYINQNDKNFDAFKERVLTKSFSFAPFKNWYQKYFGDIIPVEIEEPATTTVFSNKLEYSGIEKYQNGFKLSVNKNTIINNITSGIVVYIGEKENYGNTVIVQGIDGVDIWYGNITNTDIALYDYIEENTIIGESKTENIYFVLSKDGEYLNYEEYIAKNKNQ